MRKLTVLIDIDGTIADSVPYWLDIIAQKTGVRAQMSDITQWGMHHCPPLDKVDPNLIYGVLNEPGFNSNAPVMPGAVENVRKLMDDGHEVLFPTARFGKVAMVETLDWFTAHFPFVNLKQQVCFFPNKHLIQGDIIVDDRAETLESYWSYWPYAQLIGIEQPYNTRLSASPQYRMVPYRPDVWGRIYGIINKAAIGRGGEYSDAELKGMGQ